MIELSNLRDPKIADYSFYVRMKNREGVSPPSDAFKLGVSKLQPGSPKSMQISDITAHTLKVQWEEPDIHPALMISNTLRLKFANTAQPHLDLFVNKSKVT